MSKRPDEREAKPNEIIISVCGGVVGLCKSGKNIPKGIKITIYDFDAEECGDDPETVYKI